VLRKKFVSSGNIFIWRGVEGHPARSPIENSRLLTAPTLQWVFSF
jgi:hypothetical protein